LLGAAADCQINSIAESGLDVKWQSLLRYRQWSIAMAERMNRDLVFDHADAARDLGFKPSGFALAAEDLPL
jgi:hypothetical protein